MQAGCRNLRLGAWVLVVVSVCGGSPALGQTAKLLRHEEPLPPELSAGVAGAMPPGGQRVLLGQTTLDFWWVEELAGAPAADSGGEWRDVPEGALVGALRVQGTLKDIRGRVVKGGTYTLRFALQPVNGDHLGVSPYREFLLVSPASTDTDPAAAGHQKAVELAKQSIGSSHPGVLSIDPPLTEDAPGTLRTNETGHEAMVVEIARPGAAPLRFGVVVVGKIEA